MTNKSTNGIGKSSAPWDTQADVQHELVMLREGFKEVNRSKKSRIAFLKSAGILNNKGELAENLR